jgi:hypothetical protein
VAVVEQSTRWQQDEWKTAFQAAKTDGADFRVVTVLPDSPSEGFQFS